MDPSEGVETDLVDLGGQFLSALRDCDADALAPSLNRLMRQVETPRANIGSGPPGRAD